MPKEIPPNLWDAKRVAEFLCLAEATVRHGRAGTRSIPCIRLGGALRWDPNDVIAWREERRQRAVTRINRRFGGLAQAS